MLNKKEPLNEEEKCLCPYCKEECFLREPCRELKKEIKEEDLNAEES